MYYKRMILLCLVPLFLFASDKKVDTKAWLNYSSLSINNNLSVYAAKVNMQDFEYDHSYAIGLLHHNDASNTEVGLGYMKPADKVHALLGTFVSKTLSAQDDRILFFMHCHF